MTRLPTRRRPLISRMWALAIASAVGTTAVGLQTQIPEGVSPWWKFGLAGVALFFGALAVRGAQHQEPPQ